MAYSKDLVIIFIIMFSNKLKNRTINYYYQLLMNYLKYHLKVTILKNVLHLFYRNFKKIIFKF